MNSQGYSGEAMLLEVNTNYNGSIGQSLHKLSPVIVENTLAIAVLNGDILWVLADAPLNVKMLRHLQKSHSYQKVTPIGSGEDNVISPSYHGICNIDKCVSPEEVTRIKEAKQIYRN